MGCGLTEWSGIERNKPAVSGLGRRIYSCLIQVQWRCIELPSSLGGGQRGVASHVTCCVGPNINIYQSLPQYFGYTNVYGVLILSRNVHMHTPHTDTSTLTIHILTTPIHTHTQMIVFVYWCLCVIVYVQCVSCRVCLPSFTTGEELSSSSLTFNAIHISSIHSLTHPHRPLSLQVKLCTFIAATPLTGH